MMILVQFPVDYTSIVLISIQKLTKYQLRLLLSQYYSIQYIINLCPLVIYLWPYNSYLASSPEFNDLMTSNVAHDTI